MYTRSAAELTSDALPWSDEVFCSLVWCAGDEAAPVSDDPRFMILQAVSRRSYLFYRKIRNTPLRSTTPPIAKELPRQTRLWNERYMVYIGDRALFLEQEESSNSGQSDQSASAGDDGML